MIELFASDLDGTLLGALHAPGRIVKAAIRTATEAGFHFALATGRTFRSPHDFGFGGVDVEVVCDNGAIVLDREGAVIRHVPVDPEVLEELLRAFPGVPFDCVGLRHSYVTASREAYEAGFRSRGPAARAVDYVKLRAMYTGQVRYPDERLFDQRPEDVLANDICKVNLHLADEARTAEIEAFLAERRDRVVNAPFNPSMFEITEAGVNKGEAIAWLATYLGIPRENVAVYGDGGNDVEMLRRFSAYGHAYATHGASEAARRAAGLALGSNVLYAVPRHVTRTVREQAGHRA